MTEKEKQIMWTYHKGVGDGMTKAVDSIVRCGVPTPDGKSVCVSIEMLNTIRKGEEV